MSVQGDEVNEGTGVNLIRAERQRQIDVEGWTPAHDAEHRDDALAHAAACYLLATHPRTNVYTMTLWPWNTTWWKPSPEDRVRELVKAGALIAAEIDRLNGTRPPGVSGHTPDVTAPIDWQARFRAAAEVAEQLGWTGTGMALYDMATQLNGIEDDGRTPSPEGQRIAQAVGRALLGVPSSTEGETRDA